MSRVRMHGSALAVGASWRSVEDLGRRRVELKVGGERSGAFR